MREGTAKNIKFESIEDLFGIPREFDENTVSMVPLKNLYTYSNHPYRVIDDDKMMELVESIKENGVLEPAIVRLRALGGYEIISGHRRKRACELAGLDVMPVFVKNLSDDDAAIMMVDTNNQREELLYSERAWAYRIKYEALKHQGKKAAYSASEIISEEHGRKDRQIRIYIRLTHLQQELLDMVDKKKLSIKVAEKISYLSEVDQELLLDAILEYKVYPNMNMAIKLKEKSGSGELSEGIIKQILLVKTEDRNSITLSEKILSKYFPDDYSSEDIEKVIIELLQKWNRGINNG